MFRNGGSHTMPAHRQHFVGCHLADFTHPSIGLLGYVVRSYVPTQYDGPYNHRLSLEEGSGGLETGSDHL